MEYLLAWRMAVAKDLLRRQEVGIAKVAERVAAAKVETANRNVDDLARADHCYLFKHWPD